MQTRFLLTRSTFLFALAGALLAVSLLPARADTASDIKALQASVKTLQSQVATLQSQNTGLQDQVNALKSVTKGLSRVTDTTRTDGLKGTELYITGMNLHVVNGLGATDGDPGSTGTTHVNGLGNVIVGYNRTQGGGNDKRSGSHNLVVGDGQNYLSYGGLVGGHLNTVSGPYASVGGGQGNTASGQAASVGGGIYNSASADESSVGGGGFNAAKGPYSTVSGGLGRSASDYYNWAAGGYSQSQ